MEVNQLIVIIKKKIEKNILTQNILIKDQTYLHKSHSSHELGKFHLELIIKSEELKKHSKIKDYWYNNILCVILQYILKKTLISLVFMTEVNKATKWG